MTSIAGCPCWFGTPPAWMARACVPIGPCGPEAPTCPRCGKLGPPCEPTVSEAVDLRTGATVRVVGYCGID